MNTRLTHTIYKSEELYNRKKTSKTTFLLILRYIEGAILLQNKNIYLQKAMNIVVNAEETDINIILFKSYIYIELEQYDEADEILKRLKPFKNWLKNEKPKEYAIMLLVLAQNEFAKNHFIRGKKHFKAFSEQILYITNNNIFKILKSMLIERYIPELKQQSIDALNYAYKDGSRSPLLYISIQDYNDIILLNRAIIWGIIQGIDDNKLTYMIQFYLENHINNTLININTIELIYKKYKLPKSLEILCKLYIDKTKVDSTALEVYIEAKKQLNHIEKLDFIYLIAAYKNDYYDISPQVIHNVLSVTGLNYELQAFIYYLILNNNDMRYMEQPNRTQILDFGKICFEKKLTGIYYNSIYMYMFENDMTDNILKKYIFEHLFAYEIQILNKNIKYIWINEDELKETKSYVVKGDNIIINALSPDFNIYCLGQRQRNFYSAKNNVKIKKLIHSDKNIYRLFLNNKMSSIELIITLANYYIKKQIFTEEASEVLKSVIEYNEISDKFRHKVSIALGKYFVIKKQYEISNKYFSILKPNELTDEEAELAITVFSETGNIEKALKIYSARKKSIGDRTKLNICINAITNKVYEQEVSHISAELLLKGRSERELLDNVINYYDGTVKDWINIKKMLEALKIDTLTVDEKILKKALYTCQIEESIQNVFINMYKRNYYSKIIGDFIEYTICTILTKQQNISKNLLDCLEIEYNKNNNNEYLLYAIVSVYITNNMEINSYIHELMQKSVEIMERKQIMFPVFKQYKDKTNEFPYLEKKLPFVYNTLHDKEIYLNYKLKDELSWNRKQMKYERFGLYITTITVFYNEILDYYIEEADTGAVTEILQYINKRNTKINFNVLDEYYSINNSVIYSETLKYTEMEDIILNQQARKTYVKQFGQLL